MEGKPIHYDGSLHRNDRSDTEMASEPFTLTDEIKEKIRGNPYFIETIE